MCGDIVLRKDFSAGGVGAAVRTADGNIYTGVCIDLGSGLGFCAEVTTMAEMIKHRETLAQSDIRSLDCQVIFSEDHVVHLRELLPRHRLEST